LPINIFLFWPDSYGCLSTPLPPFPPLNLSFFVVSAAAAAAAAVVAQMKMVIAFACPVHPCDNEIKQDLVQRDFLTRAG
jgi:hypothetical protein